ncbi:Uu.00g112240.m01.CDS01 [Anthostomella pinea]|uniref:Putative gamma-glutamylcyclotransferase n=1 Tax=Anthostomella pinea TaxID=933095 RepID=A0AAI8VF94_9PEZI|nr:Uu.00g112240.m01.CDS01 [Anthostomella pinea]
MDILDELESMAQFAVQQPAELNEPECNTVKKWQSLFGYSYSEAAQKIQEHRSSFGRVTVSDEHWKMVRTEKESHGYDKEAYEHSCTIIRGPEAATHDISTKSPNNKPCSYLLKLDGPLDDAEKVKLAAGLDVAPREHEATDDAGEPASFCKVDAQAKDKILRYLSQMESRFRPTFIRDSMAAKNLSATSAYPILGMDPTMPHQRPDFANDPRLLPAQNQYPVWYFFYGTLGDPAVLKGLLGTDPSYRPATVRRGVLKTWAGKYKALVDAIDDKARVQGQAFLVRSREQEEDLRRYETDQYEVVRCEIDSEGQGVVRGLTFRFVGDCDQ